MERKLIALVLIALLGGIGGGYGIGYAINQQQFQNEINSVKAQLDMILSVLGGSNGLTNVNITNFPQLANVNVTNFPQLPYVYVTNFPDFPLLTNVYVTNFPPLTNVNVTNLPTDEQGNLKVIQPDQEQNVSIIGHSSKLLEIASGVLVGWHSTWYSDWIDIDGYAKVTVLVHIGTGTNSYALYAGEPSSPTEWRVDQVNNFVFDCVRTYDVMSPRIKIMVLNDAGTQLPLDVNVYLMA